VNFAKIANRLPAFKREWDARKGVEELYNTYRNSGLTWEEFEGPRYQRIGHLKFLLGAGLLDPDLRQVRLLTQAS